MNKEQVYYDPRAQVIFTVKRQLQNYVVVGGVGSPYFRDARSSYVRYRITNAYFKGCEPINESSHLLHDDGIGFRLRDEHQFSKVYGDSHFKYLKESDRIIKAHLKDYRTTQMPSKGDRIMKVRLKYTKGEWERQGNKILAFGKGTIAVCPSPTNDKGVLEFIANAHLIAAAPKLYEALKEARITLRVLQPDGSAVLREIDGATAKAEGK